MYRKRRYRTKRRLSRYRYRRRINRRRRIYRRKYGAQKLKALGGIAENMYCTLKFQDVEEMAGSVNYGTHVWRGNSIYDPDYSNTTGTTAANYALWATLYTKYAVWKSTIRVKFQATTNVPMWCYIFPYTSSGSTPVTPNVWQNLPGVKKVLIQGLSAGNNTSKTITYTKRIKKILGFNYTDTDLCSSMGSNPSVQFFWWVAIESFDASTNVHCLLNTEIFYYTKFYERKQYTGF